jgi:hypothetical protein
MKRIVCDNCGRFVSYADLDSGKAICRLDTPDSEFTIETFITLCRVCFPKEPRRTS